MWAFSNVILLDIEKVTLLIKRSYVFVIVEQLLVLLLTNNQIIATLSFNMSSDNKKDLSKIRHKVRHKVTFFYLFQLGKKESWLYEILIASTEGLFPLLQTSVNCVI